MTDRLVKAVEGEGYQEIISEEETRLDYLSLGKLSLQSQQTYRGETGGNEAVLVILSGVVDYSSGDQHYTELGGRKSVFDGKATAVYVPCRSQYEIKARTEAVLAVCKAKASERYEPFVVKPEDVIVHHRGKDSWKREVHDIITDNGEGRVQRIMIGETFNEPGNWSSYPPHKHDRDHLPEESKLEEIYHYQLSPEQGFGVQLLYNQDRSIDEAYIVRHGDSFAIDQGYHPVIAAGGYKIYYLWFLAGERRMYKLYDDPEHKWLME